MSQNVTTDPPVEVWGVQSLTDKMTRSKSLFHVFVAQLFVSANLWMTCCLCPTDDRLQWDRLFRLAILTLFFVVSEELWCQNIYLHRSEFVQSTVYLRQSSQKASSKPHFQHTVLVRWGLHFRPSSLTLQPRSDVCLITDMAAACFVIRDRHNAVKWQ